MAELREEIISKSFVQFLTRGYKACSLKDLEQATGLTKGAFYYYFKDKKEILKAGIEKYFTVMREIGDKELVQISSLREFFGLVLQYKEESADLSKKLFNTYVIEVIFSIGIGSVFAVSRI